MQVNEYLYVLYVSRSHYFQFIISLNIFKTAVVSGLIRVKAIPRDVIHRVDIPVRLYQIIEKPNTILWTREMYRICTKRCLCTQKYHYRL